MSFYIENAFSGFICAALTSFFLRLRRKCFTTKGTKIFAQRAQRPVLRFPFKGHKAAPAAQVQPFAKQTLCAP